MDNEFPFTHFFLPNKDKVTKFDQEKAQYEKKTENKSNNINELDKIREHNTKNNTSVNTDRIDQGSLPFLSAKKQDSSKFNTLEKSGPHYAIKSEVSGQAHNKNIIKQPFTSGDLTDIEKNIHHSLKNLLSPQKYITYFQDNFKLSKIENKTVFFTVTTSFIKTMIENHYIAHVVEAMEDHFNDEYDIDISIGASTSRSLSSNKQNILDHLKKTKDNSLSFSPPDQHAQKKEKLPDFPPYTPPEFSENKATRKKSTASSAKEAKFSLDLLQTKTELMEQVDSEVISFMNPSRPGNFIDPKKTFNNFVVGPSNNMPYASMVAISKNPGKVYPSLYIHGDSGLGKTHLLHATANEIIKRFPHLKIYLTNARDFMTEMVDAMANKKVLEFRKKYSEKIDVLIIDDIHELRNRPGTQNEFFHIFNELYNKGKQLLFTSDKSPKEIDGLEERIKTRLTWGLVLDIQHPDIETRIAILKKKAAEEDMYLSDDVIHLIASSVKDNIRELEGSLVRLGAYSSVMKVDIDYEIAKEQLKLSDFAGQKKLTTESIAQTVSDHFKIPLADLKSKVRRKEVTKARHLAMFLAHKHLNETLGKIGTFFGNRDHSSVLHAIGKIDKILKTDMELTYILQDIESKVSRLKKDD